MNVSDVLYYGNRTLMRSVEGLEEDNWHMPGACGIWSVKDIFSHLTSYELWHEEALQGFLGGGPTPMMEAMAEQGDDFNDQQVKLLKDWSAEEVLREYQSAHKRLHSLSKDIPDSTYRENGTLPWYGEGYCLEDFLVYSNYGHKREHSAQIHAFRDRL